VFDRYSAGLTDANDRLRESSISLHEMISASREAFRELCDSCIRVTAKLDDSTLQLASQLAAPAKRFEEASGLFERSAQSLGASVDQQVKRAADRSTRLEKAVSELESAHADTARIRQEAARGELETVRLMRSELENLRQAMEALGDPLKALSDSMNALQVRGTKELETALRGFNDMIAQASQQMSAASGRMGKQVEAGEQMLEYQGASLAGIKQAAESLAAVVRALEGLGRSRPWWYVSRSQDAS
jgi:DNA repair exonuclease SbcCD ATPase subunit